MFSVPPEKVELVIGENLNPKEYSVNMENGKASELLIECIAQQTRSAPKFMWYLGEQELNVSLEIITNHQ